MFMPRIRSVKPELFSHEGLYEAEVRYKLPLRLAFISLFSCCDREGRFRWQPRRLKLDMLPYDEVDIAAVLNAFIECGFIKKYEHEGEVYGCIPSWSRHQKINHREGDSELPAIENAKEMTTVAALVDDCPTVESQKDHDERTCEPRVIDACFIPESRVSHASRACPGGREEEGKGRDLLSRW